MSQTDKHTPEHGQPESGNSPDIETRQGDGQGSTQQRKAEPLSFWQTLLSVGQASFGVQNQKNKQRDFEQGSIKGFVAAALIFTVVFVLTLVVIVNVVLD